MKKIIGFVVSLIVSVSMYGQDIIVDFQKKYEKDTQFSIVNVTSKMFQMIGTMVSIEEQNVIKDLSGLRVLTTRQNSPQHYKNALSMVDKANYEELMSVEDGREKVKMFTQEKNGVVSSLVIVTDDGAEFSMIGISGKIDLKMIASLSQTLNVDKLEKLENIPEKK